MSERITKELKRIIYGVIPYYISQIFCPKSKKMIYYKYIIQYGEAHHLFLFRHEYDNFETETHYDSRCGLPYVFLPGTEKRLYFKKELKMEKVKGLFKTLLIEQDPRSPHRYFDDIKDFNDRILLDVGAAEGILSLMAIEQVSHVYLFECEEEWVAALKKTFEPWQEKVTIVPKYVGDHDDDMTLQLDSFFKSNPHQKLFIKMDIEGMERKALNGAKRLFSEPGNIKFAICTYHLRDDYQVISSFLKRYKCTFINQTGYWSHHIKSILLRGHN